jgi:ubiquinone/menaquinone biosynthesis C-methylase UbiE
MPSATRLILVLETKKLSPRHRMECYIPGHSLNATAFMAVRTLGTHCAFIEPWLKPGLQVLDCGCGPGAISVGLAEAVGPSGQVTGMDLAESQIAMAQARSAANLRFQVGSVYEMPFDDNAYDLVFSHALFQHLARPLAAIQEIRRILRPGGVAGLCSPDWNGFILSPISERVEAAIARYRALLEKNGGDTQAGRKLGSWLEAGGFSILKLNARYECYPDTKTIAEYLAIQLEHAGENDAGATLREWAMLPWSLFSESWVSAVAVKPPR